MQKKFLKKSSNSPHQPRASRKNIHVPIVVGNVGQNASVYSNTKPSPHRPINRPLSWESPHVANSVPIIESERSDSLPPPSLDDDSSNTEGSSIGFRRHSNIRTPFRQKPPLSPTPSSQETPVPQDDNESGNDRENVRPTLQSQISEESMRNPTKMLCLRQSLRHRPSNE